MASHTSVVQSLLSSHCALVVHSMQPPFAGSQLSPAPQAELLGLWLHVPFEQISVVQAIRSSQSLSPQQALQPTPAQHLLAPEQLLYEHLPARQLPLWQGSALKQSPSFRHCAVRTQPFAGKQEKPVAQAPELAVWAQLPWVHESLLQSTPSSQSAAEQHAPQVAVFLSALAQHSAPPLA
jgi:hypothetical protein